MASDTVKWPAANAAAISPAYSVNTMIRRMLSSDEIYQRNGLRQLGEQCPTPSEVRLARPESLYREAENGKQDIRCWWLLARGGFLFVLVLALNSC